MAEIVDQRPSCRDCKSQRPCSRDGAGETADQRPCGRDCKSQRPCGRDRVVETVDHRPCGRNRRSVAMWHRLQIGDHVVKTVNQTLCHSPRYIRSLVCFALIFVLPEN